MKEVPERIYMKRATKGDSSRIVIPKEFINKFGYEFYLEMYKNKIVIKPIRIGE